MADDITGKAKHVGGKIQETVGEVLGDNEMRRKGRLTQVEGEAEQDQAHAENAAEEAALRKNTAKELKRRVG
jgi:uncharacterized protein YjbJ (UPF0337 family)